MKRLAQAAAVTLALLALGVAARWETSHDERANAHRLFADWQRVGGRLVPPSLIGASTTTGLDCLLYRVTPQLDSLHLCFDSEGRLVEALGFATGGTTLVSVSTAPERAPVRLSPAALARALAAGGQVMLLDSLVPTLRAAVDPCTRVVADVSRQLAAPPKARRSAFELIAGLCGQAATGGRTAAAVAEGFQPLPALATRLAGIAARIRASANAYLVSRPSAVPYLARERRLAGRAASLLRALEAAKPAPETPVASILKAVRPCAKALERVRRGASGTRRAVRQLMSIDYGCAYLDVRLRALAVETRSHSLGLLGDVIDRAQAIAQAFVNAHADPHPYSAAELRLRRQTVAALAVFDREVRAARARITGG